MSNIKSTKDGLVEKSSGRKIISPLDVVTEAMGLIESLDNKFKNPAIKVHVLEIALSLSSHFASLKSSKAIS